MNRKCDTDSQVFFYEQDFYVLSNFSSFRVLMPTHFGDFDFDTAEHAYHYFKFLGEENQTIRSQIRRARSAHEAFRIAQQFKECRRTDWDEIKIELMRTILTAKVKQHEYVGRKLLQTGDRELIEDSWRDDFWGWGEARTGQNMLGKLWMEVRDTLRTEIAEERAE